MNDLANLSSKILAHGRDPEAIEWYLDLDWEARRYDALTYYHERPDLLAQETLTDLHLFEQLLDYWAALEEWEACAVLRDRLKYWTGDVS